MSNATDRLNQLQQYLNYYRTGGSGSGNLSGAGFGFTQSPSDINYNPNAQSNLALDFAKGQMDKQDAQQQLEDQNAAFKGMYGGNGQSQFGAPPAYVQPQNQQQQPNPYSARAMQLNGGGQNGGNTLADMFRNYNKGG